MRQNLHLWIQDTEIPPTGIQVDAAVKRIGFDVESHSVSSFMEIEHCMEIDTSNRYALRDGLGEYQAVGAGR